ncbi:MAG: aldo/keto reductase [Anaerolineales bacterium]|jgi:aryl-alcohol dehydrogenase-like predicted oxidoreductase
MEKRQFGRSGHLSSIAIFGAAAIGGVSQREADTAMEQIIAAGVNHIDVAPTYGEAEVRLAPWMERERERFFLGCKTTQRGKSGAADELRRSLERLKTTSFDLYQIHAITKMDELDQATKTGGALEAIIAAQGEGLTRYIGITGHGIEIPAVFLEALQRFDFDSVLFPINFVLYANPEYRRDAEELLQVCRERDVGTMIIKSVTRGPWGEQPKNYDTWYRPFDDPQRIQSAVNFVLSQNITGLCTAGDTRILPMVLEACDNFIPLDQTEQAALVASASQYQPLFA